MIRFKRGSVWSCQLNILKGKVRPCVIISSDKYNFDNAHQFVSVIPLSTSIDIDGANHVQMRIIDEKLCNILCDFTCPCHKNDFIKYLGVLDDVEMERIERAFAEQFEMLEVRNDYETHPKEPERIKELTNSGRKAKHSDEEKAEIISKYDDAMVLKDNKKITEMSDIYANGSRTRLTKLVSRYRKYLAG